MVFLFAGKFKQCLRSSIGSITDNVKKSNIVSNNNIQDILALDILSAVERYK